MISSHKNRGFTLVELLVSLVAGLIIALAVFAISKDATATFHEEARTATAEMSLRVAAERIRTDLDRAAFMATPNIWTDHALAYPVSAQRVPNTAPPALLTLQGIRLIPADASVQLLSAINNLWGPQFGPNGVEITGNMTSTDFFPVRLIAPGGACGGQQITLQTDTPSMWRILGLPDPQGTLRGLFQPVAQQQFLARLVDTTGKVQFAPVCNGDAVNVAGAGFAATITVDVSNAGGVKFLTTQETAGNGGIAGYCQGCTLNSVHIVRYELRKLATNGTGDCAYGGLAPVAGTGTITEKYDVVRTWRDLQGNQLGATEVISEFGIDLKFGFSADLADPTQILRPLSVFPIDDPNNNNTQLAANVTNGGCVEPNAGNVTGACPQRIRSVRFRLSTRAAMADRAQSLIAPIANAQQGTYPLRYCMNANGCVPGEPHWSRVRSVTSEVSLPNQSKSFD